MIRLAIVGVGAIGEAFAKALSGQAQCILYDKVEGRAQEVAHRTGAQAATSLAGLVAATPDWVVLAVKPQDVETVASQVDWPNGQRILSCLAGTTLARLQALFPTARVARLMPNLMIQAGVGAMALVGADFQSNELTALTDWLSRLGKVFVVDEPQLEKMTALTGSGPAFMFLVAEAFMDGAIAIGIPASQAREYVAQLLQGVGVALAQQHPAQWRQAICSPAGTTIEGIRQLEAAGVRSGVIEAIVAAYERGQELKI